MKWSVRLGSFAGIGVFVHATFLILLLWVGWSEWLAARSVAAALGGMVFILALFGCVVLHEFGHALTAARFGIRTRDITLLPIGGLARLERIPDDPRQELLVALAGPAVNVVISALLYGWLRLTGSLSPIGALAVAEGGLLERLMVINIFLAAFNMLPAFPMDGGRVLRAALALRTDYTRATQLAATIGQGMALLFGLLGLFGNPVLVFIALFVWIGASQEAAMTQMKAALGGLPVERAMITDFRTLAPSDPLSHAVDLLIAGAQEDFPIVQADTYVGMLRRQDLVAALSRRPGDTDVSTVMRTDIPSADASEMLEGAFQRLQGCGCRTIPVLRDGRLAGLLTLENIGEFVSVRRAVSGSRP